MKANKRTPESIVKDKKSVKEMIDRTTNYLDFSDDKRAQILSDDFREFNAKCGEKLGMIIGCRLHSTENAIQAILVPVKLPKRDEGNNQQEAPEGE